MKKILVTRAVLFGTVFAVLFAFSASAVNAAPMNNNDKRKPTPNNSFSKAPTWDTKYDSKHDSRYDPKHQAKPTPHNPRHDDYKPDRLPSKPIMPPPAPPRPPVVIHQDRPAPPPQVIIVGQPKKPTLLEKIVYLFK